MGIIKSGRVVIILAGRFAGRKAVVVRASEEAGTKGFGHAVVAGIERYPRRIVKAMSTKKVDKRSKIKPFVKVINFNHLMPTRHVVGFELKETFSENTLTDVEAKTETKKAIKKIFETHYKEPAAITGSSKTDKKALGAQYLFTKLRF